MTSNSTQRMREKCDIFGKGRAEEGTKDAKSSVQSTGKALKPRFNKSEPPRKNCGVGTMNSAEPEKSDFTDVDINNIHKVSLKRLFLDINKVSRRGSCCE